MAQLFDDFTSYPLSDGVLPPYLTALDGTQNYSIVEDNLGDGIPLFRHETSGTAALLVSGLPLSSGRAEIICRVRHTSNLLLRIRHVGVSESTGVLYEYNASARSIRQRNTALTTLATGTDGSASFSIFYFYRIVYEPDNTIRAKRWEGALHDEPVGWSAVATNGTISTAFESQISLAAFNMDFARYQWWGFGTDGDPAPTGPLSTTEAFALRHNPRTNKVIPVLSSPTVTDIGAACVRPRVTKGF